MAWRRFLFRPLIALISGDYFSIVSDIFNGKSFNTIHAGGALDQPSIGKFLVWFVFFSMTAIPFSFFVRWTCNMQKRSSYWTYAIVFGFVMLLAMSLLMIPAAWLTHYIYDMGITVRRIQDVILISVSVFVWQGVAIVVLWRRKPFLEASKSIVLAATPQANEIKVSETFCPTNQNMFL